MHLWDYNLNIEILHSYWIAMFLWRYMFHFMQWQYNTIWCSKNASLMQVHIDLIKAWQSPPPFLLGYGCLIGHILLVQITIYFKNKHDVVPHYCCRHIDATNQHKNHHPSPVYLHIHYSIYIIFLFYFISNFIFILLNHICIINELIFNFRHIADIAN